MREAKRIVEAGDIKATLSPAFLRMCADECELEQTRISRMFTEKFKKVNFSVKYWKDEVRAAAPGPIECEDAPLDGPDLRGYTLTDDGNADRLIAVSGGNMRYCTGIDSWILWDGRRWQSDTTHHVQTLVIETMKRLSKQAGSDEFIHKHAMRSMNARQVDSTLKMARSKVPADIGKYDTNPWLLNFANGTVNLRSGMMHNHSRDDMQMKVIERKYNRDAPCPQWLNFLEWAMGGGADASESEQDRATRFITYLQRALGYSLTGSSAEKVVFMLWGSRGNNGKSTMLDIVRMLIGEYGGQMAVGTLMTRKQESNSATADIAGLKGKRFIQTTETKGTQTLDISVLKSLSAGMGEVHARRLHENWISFQATHTIWVDMNKPPRLEEIDDQAALGRLDLIAFNMSVEKGKQDRQFSERLVAEEGEGILAWLVEGARLWVVEKELQRPPEVNREREAWRAEMDINHPWMVLITEWLEQQETAWKGSTAYMAGEEFSFSTESILAEVLKLRPADQSRLHQSIVGRLIGELGCWEKFHPRSIGRRTMYRRAEVKAEAEG